MTAADRPPATAGKLPLRLCIGWGVGTFGVSLMFNSVNLLLQRFATDYLGIAVGAFATIYFISKIYDAITDPIMGAVSDRTRTPFGRRRPYLVLGGVACAVAFIALFNAPSVEDTPHAVLIMALLLILYSTGYTIFNVPYLSMPAEMTTDYVERSRLVSFRVYAIGFGSLAGLSAAPALIALFGGGREGHAALAWLVGAAIVIASLLSFLGTHGARATERAPAPHLSQAEKWRLILTNKPFVTLLGVKVLHLASYAVTLAAFVYFVVHVLDKGYGALAWLGLANSVGMLIGAPIWSALMRVVRDKRVLYMASSLLAGLVLMTWLLATPDEPLAVTVFRKLVHGMTTAGSLLFGQSMLPDTISHDAARS
ncbi:MAG: MFS transporter, partial [Caulobacterales bacterium]|nr:MFS transporter [Caulobacterales bacterium]